MTERECVARVAWDDRGWYEDWVGITAKYPPLALGVAPLRPDELPPPPKKPPGPTPRY